jgi:hypothetical protein
LNEAWRATLTDGPAQTRKGRRRTKAVMPKAVPCQEELALLESPICLFFKEPGTNATFPVLEFKGDKIESRSTQPIAL